jgi:hypothetical protein
MLTIKKEDDTMLTVELSGKLDSTEMQMGLDQLIDATKDMENGKMLYLVENFEIPTLGAIMVEFGKLPSLFRMIGRIDKVAVLADQNWLRNMAEWEGMLFPGLDIKAFKKSNELEARAWLTA